VARTHDAILSTNVTICIIIHPLLRMEDLRMWVGVKESFKNKLVRNKLKIDRPDAQKVEGKVSEEE